MLLLRTAAPRQVAGVLCPGLLGAAAGRGYSTTSAVVGQMMDYANRQCKASNHFEIGRLVPPPGTGR